VTFQGTVRGVVGEPPCIHWSKLAGRALYGVERILDEQVLATARALPNGSLAEPTVETDWGAPGLPSHLVAVRAVDAVPATT